MAQNDLTKFFNIMFDKRQAFDIAEGILQDKRGLTGRVSFVGNPVSQPVFIMGSAKDVSVGNRCLCVRPKTSAKWVVLGSFGTAQTGYLPQRSPEDGYEIYPPGNILAVDAIPGSCMWSWYAPPEKAVVFEVQTNTTAVESGAVTELRTRGSYYIKSSSVNLFLRVRSIQSDYNHSAWSSWYECAPGSMAPGTGTVTSVFLTTPTELTTSGSPVTSSGGFTVSWHTQSANTVFSGPSSGSAAAPAFRGLTVNDLPSFNGSKLLGRSSSSSGKIQELGIGIGLYIDSGNLNASGGGGGGGTPATGVLYKQTTDINAELVLYDNVLLSDAGYFDVNFASIAPAAQCRDLRLVIQLRGDQSGDFDYSHIRINGATNSTGQTEIRTYSRNGAVTTDQVYQVLSEGNSDDAPANAFTMIEAFIADFQGSKRKLMLSQQALVGTASFPLMIETVMNDLGTSSPITEIKIEATTYPNPGTPTGNFRAGSRLTVYGTAVKTVVTDVTGDIGLTVYPHKLVGRYSGTTGQFEQISLGMGLYLIGDTLYASATGSGGGGTLDSVVGSTHIHIDNTDPINPVISTTGLVDSVSSGTDITVDNTDPDNPILNWSHDIATNKVMGRHTSGSGHWEELSLGTGLYISGSGLYASATTGNSGTVTSVDMSVPVEFNISGNPITSAGTMAVTKATQSANKVWAGPSSGSAAAPAFRALVGADMPTEDLQDMIAAFVAQGANITITYNDAGNILTFAVSGLASTNISDFTEATQDVVGGFLTNGSNISITYNDPSNTLTIAFTGTLATTVLTGVLQAAQFPALTGDITTASGALATTLATVNSNVGSFTLANVTVNAKGLVTAASSTTAIDNIPIGTTTRALGYFSALREYIGGFAAIYTHANTADRTYTFPDATGNVLLEGAELFHAYVRAASATNINLASLPSTIGGVTQASGDRFLLYGQTSTIENGIYTYNGSALVRVSDMATGAVVRPGVTVFTVEGDNQNNTYRMNASSNKIIGTDTTTWATGIVNPVMLVSVRASAASNVSTTSAPATIDNVALVSGDRVLLRGQSTTTQNGIWIFNGAGSAMTRSTDMASGSVTLSQTQVFVREGDFIVGLTYYVSNTSPVIIGTGSLTWVGYAPPALYNNVGVSGFADISAGSFRIPTSTMGAGTGSIRYRTAQSGVEMYDGTRNKFITPTGWQPYATQEGFNETMVPGLTSLPANGGTVLLPIYLHASMALGSVVIWEMDTGTLRGWRWDLYQDIDNNSSPNAALIATSTTQTFTPTVASKRTLVATSAPVVLAPGVYYLAVQNTSATQTLGLGSTAAGSNLAPTTAKTKTTSNPNGSSLDLLTGWTSVNTYWHVAMIGQAMGSAW